jgi:hypothetical protein
MILSLLAGACGGDDSDTSDQAGASGDTATGGKSGSSSAGKSGSAGKAGSSSAGKSGSGSAGKAGSTAAASGGTSSTTPPGGLGLTCSQPPPTTPIKCGGQDCSAPTDFAMNPCIAPCCVNEGGKEQCGSKSTADMLMTECSLPAKPAPECPDVDSQNGPLKGCCNTAQHKCGIISTLRPGCITESQLIMFTSQTACGMGADDAGVDQDAG